MCSIEKNADESFFTKLELLKLAEKFDYFIHFLKKFKMILILRNYMMCCKIKPSFSFYWHDLSLSYYYQAKCDEKNNDLILKAQKCILHAISLNNNNPNFWNLLGILYISLFPLLENI